MEKQFIGWSISLVCYIIGNIGAKFLPNIFCIWTALQYVVFFFIGMRIRSKEEHELTIITDQIPFFVWIVLDILLNVVLSTQRGSSIICKLVVVFMTFVVHIIGAITAWTLLQFVAARVNWQENRVFKKLSEYSMPIYLFHQQIIYFTIVFLNGKVNPWIHAGMNFIVALAGALLISEVLNKWKVTRFLFSIR